MKQILIIDDDTFICQVIQNYLKTNGFKTDVAFTGKSGLNLIKKNKFGLVLCDYRLPDITGLEVLKEIKKIAPETIVVIITAYADVRMAVQLIKQGAHDYITKPLQQEEILGLAKKLSNKGSSKVEKNKREFITGKSKLFQQAIDFAKTVAPTNLSVLIEGETGTGKEYVARYIHHNSTRKQKPFIAVDCGAIPKDLAGSELFGHIKGAFTGALKDKTGVFQQANGGTLFLDEVGNLNYQVQVQLLRALQEKVVVKLGDNKPNKVDVRIIAATNEDLIENTRNSQFREDLLHRLNEFKISLPPLRQRVEDIEVFAGHFRKSINKELGLNVVGFSTESLKILKNYSWHGNIRELKNVVNRAVLLTGKGKISPDKFPEEIINENTSVIKSETQVKGNYSLKEASEIAEKDKIINAIEQAKYNKSEAARILKIDRKTLYNKIKQYNIDI